jgi:predicted metal-binding membrane protein
MPDMRAMAMPHDAASFLGMWTAMMAAMMLPSLVPTLWRLRRVAKERGSNYSEGLIALAGAGYFMVWTALGLIALLLMKLPAVEHAGPLAGGLVMLAAGALQFTAWKTHHLACCRRAACESSPGNAAGKVLRYGLQLGFHCSCCCAGSTAILLVSGLMDLRAMTIATLAITAERLAPSGKHAARLIGVLVVAAGLWMVARAA